jgi:hypothetical protein
VLVRRLLTYASFALTGIALLLALFGSGLNFVALFVAAPSGLLALIVIAMLIASPPASLQRRMREAQLAFVCSTAVMLLAASGT